MYQLDSLRLIHLTAAGELRSPGEFKRLPLVKQEPIALPTGVSTTRTKTETGVAYTYTHETLGDLGRISVAGFGVQTKFQVDVAPGNPADPLYPQRLVMFQGIVTELEQKFHATLGEPAPDQTWLNDMPETMPFYQSFLLVESSLEMQQMLRALTPEQIQTIIRMAEQSIPLASAHDAEVIRQRLGDLQRLQAEPLTFSATAQGLYDFVQASTDEAAQALCRWHRPMCC